mmetsp:Transcript_9121/g.19679  ORF Transcript_9121/g.19679 Transcript_9121/m.19679 type:complete len:193 (-) Transcript_9121:120-698(-)
MTTTISTTILTKPKRPLSAYNLFFKDQRRQIVEAKHSTHLAGGFVGLAKTVAAKWNVLEEDGKVPYQELARIEKLAYKKRLGEWKRQQRVLKQQAKRRSSTSSQSLVSTELNEKKSSNDSPPLADVLFDTTEATRSLLSAPSTTMVVVAAHEEQQQQLEPIDLGYLHYGLDLLAHELQEDGVQWLVGLFREA